RIVMQDFPDVREDRPDVPDDVAEFIKRATKKDPAERFADAREMTQAIEQLTTRRQTLEDNGAISDDDQNTLLSPPPAKTLAKIKFWLDEQAQGGNKADQDEGKTMVSPSSRRASDRTKRGAAQEPARSKAGLWLALSALVVAAVLVGIWQPWRAAELSPFAVAESFERAGQFDAAVTATNQVYAADATLTGKEARLAALYLAWAARLRDSQDLGGS